MARFTVFFSVALTAGAEKTVVRWNTPASRKGTLRRLNIADKLAGSTDEGIRWKIYTGGTDGTGTSQTPLALNGQSAAVATAKVNYTVEPTGSPTEVLRGAIPAGGAADLAFEGEEGLTVAHSSAIALALTATQSRASGIVEGFAEFEE